MRSIVLSLLLLLICAQLYAQDRSLAIGQWRTHLPYNAGAYVTQSPDKVYFSTEEAILIIDKEDFLMVAMHKILTYL